jgi:hypothetical protein
MGKIKMQKPSKSEMCPVGYHAVRGHYRHCKSCTRTWVDAHIRKNPGSKKMYLPENLLYIFWNSKKNYGKLNAINGFPPHHELDGIIQFWLEYWTSRFKLFPKIDPLLIKALIALESSFNPKADPKVSHSFAYGLMQIVDTARKSLTGKIRSSVTRDYMTVARSDLEDPVVNIAVGIRWLVVKYFNIRKKKGNSVHNTIKAYYGNRKENENEKYLNKILKLYNSSR